MSAPMDEGKFLQFLAQANAELLENGTGQKMAFTLIVWDLGEPGTARFVSNIDAEQQRNALREILMALDNGHARMKRPGENDNQDPSLN